MRIISGTHKGKQLVPPRNYKARPTTDYAKESLFNILNNLVDFESIKVLDLFSGTGSISYEFASRGCPHIDLVEIESKNFSFIKQTVQQLGFSQIKLIRNDALKFLGFCDTTYDIIFADPPYNMTTIAQIPELIFERNLLNLDGFLILEHSDQNDFSDSPHFSEKRYYGSVNFSFFR